MKFSLKSEVVDREFEVDTFDAGSGKLGIKDACLKNILINEMPEERDVNYDIQPIIASAGYCAVKCTITDNTGRKVQEFNDVSLNHLEKDDAFVKQHPLTQAVQSAISAAVKAYLGWPRVLPDEGYEATTVISDDDIVLPPNGVDNTEKSSTGTDSKDTTSRVGMNQPEGSKLVMDNTKAENNAKTEEEDLSSYTLEELGNMVVTTGTHKDKTLAQVWKEKPSWFDYILNNSSAKYKYAKEYVKRKKS